MQKFTLTTTAIALAAFFTTGAAWAEGSDSKPGSKSTPAQIFSIDSVLYGCVPGSQAKGPDLKKCTKLPSNVVDLIKAAGTKIPTLSTTAPTTPPSTTTTATTTGSKPDDDSPDVTVVGTPQGPKSCPVSAFTSDKLLDLTQCQDAAKGKKVHAVCRPVTTAPVPTPLPSTGTSTGTTTTTGTTTSATTGTTTSSTGTTTASGTTSDTAPTSNTNTLLTCAMPSDTQSNEKSKLKEFNTACKGGGTHVVTGGYDATSGKVDITITFTACIDERGVTHDGSAIMQGTLTPTAGSTSLFDLDETKTINSSLTFSGGGAMTRACTVTRKGSYNNSTGAFKGTINRTNCSMTGDYLFKKGLIDNLIENASEAEPI